MTNNEALNLELFKNIPRPYTCPNCDGHGNCLKQPYQLNPTALKCWACDGKGIVWKS